ncbi:MAG: acyl-CoA dehydratase activase-related protein [Lachnospiraceae bacterium]
MRIGIDIGSTTIKSVVLDDNDKIIHKSYERHYAMITEKAREVLQGLVDEFHITKPVKIAFSGSAGMGLCERAKLPFVQEVYATKVAISHRLPDTDVVIELGGEDAKILFLQGNLEVRMNGSCAGGTGAFADQMASLMQISGDEMNELAAKHEKIYSIASRCGVFAKTDIQPLLNQGARKEDISASIFYAIVNQTITGLAQGRTIEGNIVYLGGPLTFMSELRKSFDSTLHCRGICPEDSLVYVALGTAYYAEEEIDLVEVIKAIGEKPENVGSITLPPLFASNEEREEFRIRHAQHKVPRREGEDYEGEAYLGIDSGSTTLKVILLDREGQILFSKYASNQGKPIDVVKDAMLEMYEKYPGITIKAGGVTGYGEDMIRNALGVDYGLVETVAHYTSAKSFMPDVEFIIDIGGQDMKCFKIRNGTIDNIFLNEACSSGCGSFLQTFAASMGYSIEEFARLGEKGDRPVDLGSRCTVFMNSSVKQAQKEGVSVENISAGLSISVVKNALYKVIRVHSAEELGKRIVVQGGTFLNDAVLRAFEQEMGVEVIRPDIAGLMGAYGAALYAREMAGKHPEKTSTVLDYDAMKAFTYEIRGVTCNGCNNHCQLTVNEFGGGRKFIGGNRCEKPVTNQTQDVSLNLYEYKLHKLENYASKAGERGVIGLPMALNMYEMYPFWHTFFTELGYEVKMSGFSNRKLYLSGQGTIPSDTVCFPAKLVHGHIQKLVDEGADYIFYPCMTFNFDEKRSDNHYNCAVIAGYPEVIEANMTKLVGTKLIREYVGPHQRSTFARQMRRIIDKHLDASISMQEIRKAAKQAYKAYDVYMQDIRREGQRIIGEAEKQGKPIIVLAGRPYHADPEINHGIHKLIGQLGFAVVSEDSVAGEVPRFRLNMLNQWTYHARLFSASEYVAHRNDMYLVHLVSFGCGLDALTTDEVRSILEEQGKLYTQIKIDEVTNLGAVKIRLRSLIATIEQSGATERKSGGDTQT